MSEKVLELNDELLNKLSDKIPTTIDDINGTIEIIKKDVVENRKLSINKKCTFTCDEDGLRRFIEFNKSLGNIIDDEGHYRNAFYMLLYKQKLAN